MSDYLKDFPISDDDLDSAIELAKRREEHQRSLPPLAYKPTVVNAPAPAAVPYIVRRAADLMGGEPLRWRIHSVLPVSGLAGLYGPSGSGKSFLLLHMLSAIAEDAGNWFGRRVTPAPVAYVCLEGEAGIGKRLKAWSIHRGKDLPDTFNIIVSQPLDLRSISDVDRLCDALRAAGVKDGVVAIDTLAQATPGFDENSGQDMSQVLAASKMVQASLGGLVILVHHTGKTDGKGLRGHSSLLAALDSAIEVTRDGFERKWSIAKSKDDADGTSSSFELRTIEIGEDADGNPVTSCVIEPCVTQIWTPPQPKTANQKLVYDAIGKLLTGSRKTGKDPAHPTRPWVFLDDAIEAGSAVLVDEPKRRKDRARRALEQMISAGIYARDEECIWLR